MRALVTGSTGFIGSHLVTELRARGWDLVCLTPRAVNCDDLSIVCLIADLLDLNTLDLDPKQVGPVDTIFHFAAMLPHVGSGSAISFLQANAVATLRLLELAERLDVKAFVYASGVSVIGEPQELPITEDHSVTPLQPYILGKLCGELACEMVRLTQGRRITSLRITSPYGIGMLNTSVLPRFVQQGLSSENISWYGSGERTQDFVHVKDVVAACLLAASTSSPGVYNIGSGISTSMKKLAELILTLIPESRSQALPADKPDLQENCRWEVDIAKAYNNLNYHPTVRLEDGVREYIDFMRSGAPVCRWWS